MIKNTIPPAAHSTNLLIFTCERADFLRTLCFLYTDTCSSLMAATWGYYRPLLDVSPIHWKSVSWGYSVFPTLAFILARFYTIVHAKMFWKGKLNDYETPAIGSNYCYNLCNSWAICDFSWWSNDRKRHRWKMNFTFNLSDFVKGKVEV